MAEYGAEVAGSIQKSWVTAELRRKVQSSLAVNNEYSKILLDYRKEGKKRDESWPCFFNWISRLHLERRGMFVFKTINATSTHDSATTILNSILHTMLFCHTVKRDPFFLLIINQNTSVRKQQTNHQKISSFHHKTKMPEGNPNIVSTLKTWYTHQSRTDRDVFTKSFHLQHPNHQPRGKHPEITLKQ